MLRTYLSFLLFIPFWSCGQKHQPHTTVRWYSLGDVNVSVSVTDFGGHDRPVYIHVHDDETTSLQAALPLLQRDGGTLVKINNHGNRNIVFTLDSAEYEFDPNRIFSRNGIVQTLILHKRISNQSIDVIGGFARFFLSQVPSKSGLVVALHNNSNGGLSVESYAGNGEEAKEAADVSINRVADPDDFIITTEKGIFKLFRNDFNIILQDNEFATDDGSLSIHFAKQKIPYLNCETEHGHHRQFDIMLRAVHDSVDRIMFNPRR